MRENSTQKLWDLILKAQSSKLDKYDFDNFQIRHYQIKKETIDSIIAYSKSVSSVRSKFNNRILVNLN